MWAWKLWLRLGEGAGAWTPAPVPALLGVAGRVGRLRLGRRKQLRTLRGGSHCLGLLVLASDTCTYMSKLQTREGGKCASAWWQHPWFRLCDPRGVTWPLWAWELDMGSRVLSTLHAGPAGHQLPDPVWLLPGEDNSC